MDPEHDTKVIELLQIVEKAQRAGIPPGRELDKKFEDFMVACIADRADLRDMLGQVSNDLKTNTEITKQVADVLASFRVIAAIAKWLAAIVAGVVAVRHGMDWFKSG